MIELVISVFIIYRKGDAVFINIPLAAATLLIKFQFHLHIAVVCAHFAADFTTSADYACHRDIS